jgi:hypothetical protein
MLKYWRMFPFGFLGMTTVVATEQVLPALMEPRGYLL